MVRLKSSDFKAEKSLMRTADEEVSKSELETQKTAIYTQCDRGIETAFDILNNKLELENFTGTKPILLEQDIYSCVSL